MNGEEDKKKPGDGILEMLREAGVSTKDLEDKKHAFWDTQVRQEEWRIFEYC